MHPSQRQIILASGSPRRKELLEQLGFLPRVERADVPEFPEEGEDAEAYTRRLAESKAAAVASRLQDGPRWVLAADTVVVCGERILEKPADAQDAVQMLLALSDTWHVVVTSFCWHDRESERHATRTVSTEVRFRPLDEAWVRRYVATGEPMDKAGAYGIQDIGAALVQKINGSYSSVVGLPVCEVVQTLEELGALSTFPFAPADS